MISLSGIDDSDLSQERNLARARLILATASLAAIYADPTGPVLRYAATAYPLLIAYVVVSVGYLFALGRMRGLPRWLAPAAHVFDMLSLAILTAITGASSSPLFPFFTFIVLAAAFRWGYRETLLTTLVIMWVLIGEAFVLQMWRESAATELEVSVFLVRGTYMAIAGVLAAYLASHEKQLRLESGLVARILSRLRSETTLENALEIASRELLRAFGAKSVAVVVREAVS